MVNWISSRVPDHCSSHQSQRRLSETVTRSGRELNVAKCSRNPPILSQAKYLGGLRGCMLRAEPVVSRKQSRPSAVVPSLSREHFPPAGVQCSAAPESRHDFDRVAALRAAAVNKEATLSAPTILPGAPGARKWVVRRGAAAGDRGQGGVSHGRRRENPRS